jgi:hypothetical protein
MAGLSSVPILKERASMLSASIKQRAFLLLGVSDRIANEIINAGCVHGAAETETLKAKRSRLSTLVFW